MRQKLPDSGMMNAPNPDAVRIREAQAHELDRVSELLESVDLPSVCVTDQFPDAYILAEFDGTFVAVAGLEVHGGYGLLRSVAVLPEYRGTGLAKRLVDRCMNRARLLRLGAVYLLTTTAHGYFLRYGFADCERTEVPAPIRASREFSAVCPESAAVMVLSPAG